MRHVHNLASLSCLCATITLCGVAGAKDSDEQDLVLQINQLTPELVVEIAKIGKERTINVPAHTDILKVISKYCGSANARRYYLPLFIAANAANREIKAGQTVLTRQTMLHIPACIYAEEKTTAVIVNSIGPQWTSPVAIPKSLTAILPNDPKTGLMVGKWSPANQASSLGLGDNPSELAEQMVNFDRLKSASKTTKMTAVGYHAVLPAALDQQGVTLAGQFSSDRLDDPFARSAYNKLVESVSKAEDVSKVGHDPAVYLSSIEVERTARTQDVLASNQYLDFSRLQTGSAFLSSDFVPGTYTVRVKPDIDAAKAKEAVAAIPPSVLPGAYLNHDYGAYLEDPDNRQENGQPCLSAESAKWPINIAEMKEVLELRKAAKKKPVAGELLVFDTGFPRGQVGTLPFKSTYFVSKVGEVIDPDNEPYLWTTANPPEYFYPGARYSDHGVGVLTLALGGVEILKQDILSDNVESQAGYVISLMGYSLPSNSSELAMDGNGALRSLSGQTWGQAPVVGVNLSLRFYSDVVRDHNPASSIKDHPTVLYVFAAGNDNRDVAVPPEVDPAFWGGDQYDHSITVAAADAAGNLWSKSNWSTTHVDLAAPGCSVPTFSWDNAHKKFVPNQVSGTSSAAPLVSFAGNFLRDLSDSVRIKSRILYSGSYNGNLAKKVWSSRMLDIPNALALHFDTVRDRSGNLLIGSVQWPQGGVGVCGQPQHRGALAQLSLVMDGDDSSANTSGEKTIAQISAVYRDDKYNTYKISFASPCLLDDAEMTDIRFQKAKIDNSGFVEKDGVVQHFNMRDWRSITFCEICFFSNSGN